MGDETEDVGEGNTDPEGDKGEMKGMSEWVAKEGQRGCGGVRAHMESYCWSEGE